MKKIIMIISIITGLVLIPNFTVMAIGGSHIESPDEPRIDRLTQCILVLGAGVRPDGTPSAMLRDRLDRGIELYRKGFAPKLLLSGDNGQETYNEIAVMKKYVLDAGVPDEDVFLDHAGFSTYESVYRAREVFRVHSMIVVTQRYHEYRALYIAEILGLNAKGVPAAEIRYGGQVFRDVREILARDKDCVKAVLQPRSKYVGDPIDIRGDGRVTWD